MCNIQTDLIDWYVLEISSENALDDELIVA